MPAHTLHRHHRHLPAPGLIFLRRADLATTARALHVLSANPAAQRL
ncbi:hypothetical protein [Xanthomonas cassavae]